MVKPGAAFRGALIAKSHTGLRLSPWIGLGGANLAPCRCVYPQGYYHFESGMLSPVMVLGPDLGFMALDCAFFSASPSSEPHLNAGA